MDKSKKYKRAWREVLAENESLRSQIATLKMEKESLEKEIEKLKKPTARKASSTTGTSKKKPTGSSRSYSRRVSSSLF